MKSEHDEKMMILQRYHRMTHKMNHLLTRRSPANLLLAASLGAALALAGCSGTPEKDPAGGVPVETGAEGNGQQQQGKVGKAAIPAYEPLAFRQGEVEVEKLGEQDGVEVYRVGDVTLIYKSNPAKPVVSTQLYLVGGEANMTRELAGIEMMALNVAASGGTEKTPKDAFNARLDALGASIGGFTDRDYSGFAFKTVTDHFDTVWDLFGQAVLQPAFPKDEVELVRTRQLASIDQMYEDPDSLVSHVATQLLFEGHPYESIQMGTKENVAGFTRDELRAYHRSLLDPERMVLVVVGPVPVEQVIARTKATFGKLARGDYQERELPGFDLKDKRLAVVDQNLPTNYVFGLFAAPEPGHKDYAALKLALTYLDNRLFDEIRSKRGLTYAVASGLGKRRSNYGYLYVTAEDPAQTMPAIFEEIEQLKKNRLDPQVLKETLNVFITRHYMGQETNSGQAGSLADAQIIADDWRQADRFLDQLKAVTPEDVQRVAETYLRDYHFGVVGPEEKLPREVFTP